MLTIGSYGQGAQAPKRDRRVRELRLDLRRYCYHEATYEIIRWPAPFLRA